MLFTANAIILLNATKGSFKRNRQALTVLSSDMAVSAKIKITALEFMKKIHLITFLKRIIEKQNKIKEFNKRHF